MSTITLKKLGFFSLAAAALLVLGTPDAFAESGTFKGSVDKLTEQAEALPGFISFVLYIIGIALVGKGVLAGKKYSENPAQASGGLLAVLGPLVVGGLLIALPSVANLVINSTIDEDNDVQFQSFGGDSDS